MASKVASRSEVEASLYALPLLNLEPEQVLSDLAGQYLYVALHEIFYSLLMVEITCGWRI